MGTKMTHTARAELTNVVRRRYCDATGAEKRKILVHKSTICVFPCISATDGALIV
jgi:hypothetical protein